MGSWTQRLGCRLATNVFSGKSCFNLLYHGGRFHVRRLLVNATFWSTLLNDIVDKHPDLWSSVRLGIMEDELWVIWKATMTWVKRWSPKSFFFSKHSRSYLSTGSCPPKCCKIWSRLLPCRTHTASSVAYVFARYVYYWTCVGFVGWPLTRPTASTNGFWVRMQAIWIDLFKSDTQVTWVRQVNRVTLTRIKILSRERSH